MKNVVSFETALRLKEAGFPQPEPEVGQVWYNPDFGLFVVGRRSFIDAYVITIFYPEKGRVLEKEISSFRDCVFTPTATDILEQLDGYVTDGETCYFVNAANELVNEYLAKNPAEAAALAWLEIHEKK